MSINFFQFLKIFIQHILQPELILEDISNIQVPHKVKVLLPLKAQNILTEIVLQSERGHIL